MPRKKAEPAPVQDAVEQLTEQLQQDAERMQQQLLQPPLKELIRRLTDAINVTVARKHLATKPAGKNQITYMPHWHVANYLDLIVGLWEWEIHDVTVGEKRLFLTGRLTIYGCDGRLSRDATGCEELSTGSYGDPSSNAEAMALRRAASKFGFCRQLWAKGK